MLTTGNTQQLTRKKVMAKKVKNKKVAPKGSHYMPDGSLMKDSAMKYNSNKKQTKK
tara:strand:- start:2386 stop:2553 length:168 start_codon:yes stop_codon:yes gene_type:complete